MAEYGEDVFGETEEQFENQSFEFLKQEQSLIEDVPQYTSSVDVVTDTFSTLIAPQTDDQREVTRNELNFNEYMTGRNTSNSNSMGLFYQSEQARSANDTGRIPTSMLPTASRIPQNGDRRETMFPRSNPNVSMTGGNQFQQYPSTVPHQSKQGRPVSNMNVRTNRPDNGMSMSPAKSSNVGGAYGRGYQSDSDSDDVARAPKKQKIEQDKPFTCKVCGYTFKRIDYLRNHLRNIHKVNDVFSCRADGCDECFSTRQALRQHDDNVHLKKKPLFCKYCKSPYLSLKNLMDHEATHVVGKESDEDNQTYALEMLHQEPMTSTPGLSMDSEKINSQPIEIHRKSKSMCNLNVASGPFQRPKKKIYNSVEVLVDLHSEASPTTPTGSSGSVIVNSEKAKTMPPLTEDVNDFVDKIEQWSVSVVDTNEKARNVMTACMKAFFNLNLNSEPEETN